MFKKDQSGKSNQEKKEEQPSNSESELQIKLKAYEENRQETNKYYEILFNDLKNKYIQGITAILKQYHDSRIAIKKNPQLDKKTTNYLQKQMNVEYETKKGISYEDFIILKNKWNALFDKYEKEAKKIAFTQLRLEKRKVHSKFLSQYNKDVEKLREKATKDVRKLEQYKAQLSNMQIDFSDMKGKEQQLKEEINDINKKKEEQTKELDALKLEMKAMSDEYFEKLKTFDSLKKQYEIKIVHIEEDYQKKFDDLEQKHRAKFNEALKTSNEKENKIKSLELELKTSKEELSIMQEKELDKIESEYQEEVDKNSEVVKQKGEKLEEMKTKVDIKLKELNDKKENAKYLGTQSSKVMKKRLKLSKKSFQVPPIDLGNDTEEHDAMVNLIKKKANNDYHENKMLVTFINKIIEHFSKERDTQPEQVQLTTEYNIIPNGRIASLFDLIYPHANWNERIIDDDLLL